MDTASWGGREAVRALIPTQIMTAVLPLLVLVSAQLEDGDYRCLAPILWGHHLESHENAPTAPVGSRLHCRIRASYMLLAGMLLVYAVCRENHNSDHSAYSG